MTLLELPIRKPRLKRRQPVHTGNGHAAKVWPQPRPRVRLNVQQYHKMLAEGILEEGAPIELLNGRLEWKDRSAAGEDPMTVAPEHSFVVQAVSDLSPKFKRLGASVRAQQPVTLPPYNEPEPDLSIVIGRGDRYRDGHPGAKDILCGVEVADSSLYRDRGRKLRIYANSGIAVYIILNLIDRVAEVYLQPLIGKGRYGDTTTLGLKDRLTFPAPGGKSVAVRVGSLFP